MLGSYERNWSNISENQFEDDSFSVGHVVYVYWQQSRYCLRQCKNKYEIIAHKSRAETYCFDNRVKLSWKHNALSVLKTEKLSFWY